MKLFFPSRDLKKKKRKPNFQNYNMGISVPCISFSSYALLIIKDKCSLRHALLN